MEMSNISGLSLLGVTVKSVLNFTLDYVIKCMLLLKCDSYHKAADARRTNKDRDTCTAVALSNGCKRMVPFGHFNQLNFLSSNDFFGFHFH